MRWWAKICAFRLLSVLPGGATLYRLAQERVTKSLTPTPERLGQKIQVGLRYVEWLERHGCLDRLFSGTHLDFGCGWHPTVPLLFYSLGAARQYLLDAQPVLDMRLLQEMVPRFIAATGTVPAPPHARFQRMPPPPSPQPLAEYLSSMGITYHAPYLSDLPRLAQSADVVTSTQVFPCIPSKEVPRFLSYLHGMLSPGGLLMATVHIREPSLGWRQIQYPPWLWERAVNSRLIGFSQLRASEYRALLERGGFDLEHFEIEPGTEQDLRDLDRIRIAPCFRRFPREELAAKHLFFVARKR